MGRDARCDLREQLLELVDDEQQLGVVGREHRPQRPSSALVRIRRAPRTATLAGSTATLSSSLSSASNGCGAGVISGGEPTTRLRECPAAHGWEQPGLHDARLAAPARADHGEEATAANRRYRGGRRVGRRVVPCRRTRRRRRRRRRAAPCTGWRTSANGPDRMGPGPRVRGGDRPTNATTRSYRRDASGAVARSITRATGWRQRPTNLLDAAGQAGHRLRRDHAEAVDVGRGSDRFAGRVAPVTRTAGSTSRCPNRRRTGPHRRRLRCRSRTGRRCRRRRSGRSRA